jgi:hypothetical protein
MPRRSSAPPTGRICSIGTTQNAASGRSASSMARQSV